MEQGLVMGFLLTTMPNRSGVAAGKSQVTTTEATNDDPLIA